MARIDRATDMIILDDGTVIHVAPNARVHATNGQVMTLDDLRPGMVVVMRVDRYTATQSSSAVQPGSSDMSGSALPRQAFAPATFSAKDVLIVRREDGRAG